MYFRRRLNLFFNIPFRIISKCKNLFRKLITVFNVHLIYPFNCLLWTQHIVWDARELFFQENKSGFNRYDIIVRYLAIENYYGQNSYGFSLYKRMQAARINENWVESSFNRFIKLIKSYDNNGYDMSSEIELDKKLKLIDGSHRVSLALFHKQYRIPCKVRPVFGNVYYGLEWFIEKGFSLKEIEILHSTYKKISQTASEPFIVTLWPPVQEYFEDIMDRLRLLGNVTMYKDYVYDDFTFGAIVRGVYSVDDIAKWKIEKKIAYMSSTPIKKIRVVMLELPHPKFRLKSTNNNTLSASCERIKRIIRNCYKDRIENYMHDIIIHIGDNYYQNMHIRKIFEMLPIDLVSILDNISNCNYAIVKFDVPYMPQEFPLKYPLNKDLDILCFDSCEYNKVRRILLESLELYKDIYAIRIVEKQRTRGDVYRSLIRLELENFLVFQFDVSYRIDNMKNNFESDLVENRQRRLNFYTSSLEFELLVRICELKENPNKKHHLQFLQKNRANLQKDLCDKYLSFNWHKIINGVEK